jgi:hypothetical protein
VNKYTLSIVIPCYKIDKNANYLNLLLKSIYDQRESRFDLEKIILINDSPEIELEYYIESKYINNKLFIYKNVINSGQAFSRNFGLSLVNSDFVHFIDQDDFINNDFYLSLQPNADILIANCILYKKDDYKNHAKLLKNIVLTFFNKIKKLKFFLIFDNIILSPGQAVFRTNIVKQVSGFPELKNYGSDDYGLMFNIAKHNYTYGYFGNAKYFHRLHEIQGKQFLNMQASRNEFLNSSNNLFNWLCSTELFPINLLKKVLYVIFYNRF